VLLLCVPSSHLLHVCVLLCLVHLVPCTLHQRVDLCRTQYHREESTQSKSNACIRGALGCVRHQWCCSTMHLGRNKLPPAIRPRNCVLDGRSTHTCKPIDSVQPSRAEVIQLGKTRTVQTFSHVSAACHRSVSTCSFFARVVCLHSGVLRAVEHLQAQTQQDAVLLMGCARNV
jgi:hypothetical protein